MMDVDLRFETWADLEKAAKSISDFGRDRIDGKVAFLATIRRNGFPRTHPVTPVVTASGCYIFVDPSSSKIMDFGANPKYSLHCSMSDSSGSSGEFQMTGMVRRVENTDTRAMAEAACSYRPANRFALHELLLTEAIATQYRGGRPNRQKWAASDD